MSALTSRKVAMVCILVFQAIFIVVFAFFVKYDSIANPLKPVLYENVSVLEDASPDSQYPLFQDIHVMIFIGFGFLMTFLKKYAFSALGFTFLVASLVIQWAILCQGFWSFRSVNDRIHLNVLTIMNADVAAASVLISFGAVLGKTSPIQLLIMAILETALFAANEHLGVEVLEAVDAGGSMYVHVFGAYFGLAVSFVLAQGVSTEENSNDLESSSYQSDINSMLGTLFLWMFWPSFNAGFLSEDQKYRAVVNTYLSLCASCLTTFAFSSILNEEKKFVMAHVQNATLAGGVCVGTVCNMMVQPYGALLIGSFAGTLSTVGFRFIQDFLRKKLHIHDTCGVNNLHGMPGIAAGLIGAIMAALANNNIYGIRLSDVFPAMGPKHNRAAKVQAGYQLAGLFATLGISISGGLVTGSVSLIPEGGLAVRNYGKIEKKFNDDFLWDLPKEELKGGVVRTSNVLKF